jgi:hypothetical protein
MTATTDITIIGIRDTLKELKQIDPELRKGFDRRYKQITQPVIDAAKNLIPELPLSGMARSWQKGRLGPWDRRVVQRSITSKVDTRRGQTAIMRIQLKSAAGSVFDMAGRRRDNPFARRLEGKGWGGASRVMWNAYNRRENEVDRQLNELVDDLIKTVNERLR